MNICTGEILVPLFTTTILEIPSLNYRKLHCLCYILSESKKSTNFILFYPLHIYTSF